MPPFLFKKNFEQNKVKYEKQFQISLGGKQVIYKNWLSMQDNDRFGGWTIDKQNLLSHINKENYLESEYTIIIDGKPSSTTEIDYYELDKIHLYTYQKDSTSQAEWSLLLLQCYTICSINDAHKVKEIQLANSFFEQNHPISKVSTFLYIHGCERNWLWGRLGQMNGAWLYPNALEYFKRFL